MTSTEYIEVAYSFGFKLDRYGHMQLESEGEKYRLKATKTGRNLRFEIQIVHEASEYSRASKEWALFSKPLKTFDSKYFKYYLGARLKPLDK